MVSVTGAASGTCRLYPLAPTARTPTALRSCGRRAPRRLPRAIVEVGRASRGDDAGRGQHPALRAAPRRRSVVLAESLARSARIHAHPDRISSGRHQRHPPPRGDGGRYRGGDAAPPRRRRGRDHRRADRRVCTCRITCALLPEARTARGHRPAQPGDGETATAAAERDQLARTAGVGARAARPGAEREPRHEPVGLAEPDAAASRRARSRAPRPRSPPHSSRALPMPWRRWAGTTARLWTWTTSSLFTGEYGAALRKTAPAKLPSYSATTRRSPGLVAQPLDGGGHVVERLFGRATTEKGLPQLGQRLRHRQEWLRAWPPRTDSSTTSRSTKERHRPVPP